ncbi:MAG: helix-turn-helix transcriptional regulator [Pseudomonadota bacterium]
MLDKRDLAATFKSRVGELLKTYPGSQSRFAASIGLDRSALTQLLAAQTTRLPRADTLCRIAEVHQVSLDWLLGLNEIDDRPALVTATLEVEEVSGPGESTQLAEWHREAIGTKIRYVPSRVPDLLRTEAVIAFEHSRGRGARTDTQIRDAEDRLNYSRRPETDMEVCTTVQLVEGLRDGTGVFARLSEPMRREQLHHMARLVDELYPTFRLFLFDGLSAYSAPYTVFGMQRASIYLGDMYVVLTARDHIRALTEHFDQLIRRAIINPHECAAYLSTQADQMTTAAKRGA